MSLSVLPLSSICSYTLPYITASAENTDSFHTTNTERRSAMQMNENEGFVRNSICAHIEGIQYA